VQIVVNARWTEGMGSSLRVGVKTLMTFAPAAKAVVIALADQPDLPAAHITTLIKTQRATGRSIVASECDGIRGPPVLFTASHFPALLALQGDAGARSLLKSHAHEVAVVPLSVARDLDTPADYAAYVKGSSDIP